MRNKAGFMILTLLLLTVPALANAWTLAVKVAGGTDTNNVQVAYSYQTGTQGVDETTKTVTNTFKSSSSYTYPIGPVTVTAANGYTAGSLTLDGAPIVNGVQLPTSGNHVLAVAYATTQTTFSVNLTQDPNGGGQIYAENKNNTWTATSVTGLTALDTVPIAIAADANHKIVSYNLGNGVVNMPANSAAGQVLSLTAAAGKTVTATFGVAGQTTATLFAPTNGVTGTPITVNVTASSNDSPLTYAFTVSPAPAVAGVGGGANSSYAFTPSAATTYTVTATVTSPNMVAAVVNTATIIVADASVNANQACVSCHSTQSPTIVANYNASIHNNALGESTCEGCHSTKTPHSANVNTINVNKSTFFVISSAANGIAKNALYCSLCHKPTSYGDFSAPHDLSQKGADLGVTCAQCHTTTNTAVLGTGDAHAIQGTTIVVDGATGCINCHSVGQKAIAGKVNDNNGVRAITGEFTKWSHHVTGTTVQDAHCAACHLEGKAVNGKVVVDATYHMKDAQTHLRNADTDADMAWDPAAPNHTTMDNFCMSCHDANGAISTGSIAVRAIIVPVAGKIASATNPFGDTISNRYDKMQRPAVTNVNDQFNTTNNSHHGVKGPRYTGRTRVAGPRQIASAANFANNSSQTLQGVRSTIYDAGNFNALYTPLANAGGEAAPRTGAATLGDDSTMHCGDCHTVGQFRAADVNVASINKAVIGAHGSNNEYMLRNSIGTDERHTQNAYTVSLPTIANGNGNVVTQTNPNGAFLVCYNCHSYNKYGSTFIGTGADAGNAAGNPLSNIQSHAGEYASAGRCNGAGNTIPFAGYTTGTATDGSQFGNRIFGKPASAVNVAGGEQAPQFGNAFGIQCLDCHNSGIGNAYGGIHGSANDTTWNNGTTTITPASLGAGKGGYYINGMGNATKVERFLPGLGDAMHTPGTLGGVTGGTIFAPAGVTYTITTGGIANDTNWEQKHWQQTATTVINFGIAGTPGAGVTGNVSAGAGCYTLGAAQAAPSAIITTDMTSGLVGPSVTGAGGAATQALDTWGGCDDHTAGQGKGNHGFLKRIVRPVTY